MKKKLLYVFLILISIILFGCQMGSNNGTNSSLELEEIETMRIGDTIKLTVNLISLEGNIIFESSNEKILIVDEDGVVTAISTGKATIFATIELKDINKIYSDEIEIEVIEDKPKHEHKECLECGLCTDENCDGEESDKCLGHEIVPSHEHIKCSECGLCISSDCNGEASDKCLGHEIVDEHDCEDYKSDWILPENIVCGQTGTKKIICTKCEKELQKATYKLEHQYEMEVIQDKTCEQNGKIKYTCSLCDKTYTETDYSNGHEESEIEIVVSATENTLGTKRISCIYCDKVIKEFNYVDNAYHKHGKLSVNGADLVNQYGEKVQLYGLSTHGLQWFSKVVNFDTICEIQENFGNNIIRFALYTDEDGYCDGSDATKKKMLETIQKGIEIATELGLYVIVDWHMVGAENVLDKNPLTYLEEAKEFFGYMSEYYKDQDNIIYEIMNEPNGSTTWDDCKKYANEIIPIIRKNTDAVVLVGNPKWTADLTSVMKSPLTGYTNIMYTYHFYAADHTNTSQVVKAYDSGFPVFISEFGFMLSSGDGSISETNGNKWKQVLDSRNISYVAWNISNSKGSASIFKYNTSNLSDVSDSNLKEWGVYLKNWYRAKSLNTNSDNNEEELIAEIELIIDDEQTGFLQCFIVSSNHSTSRLDYDWSSTNESILTISSYSTITIHGDGKCSIICKNKSTGKIGILDVEVVNNKIVSYVSRYTE